MDLRRTGDRDLDGMLRQASDELRHLNDIPILNGVLIQDVDLANATDVLIRHRLNRRWRGWWVTNLEGATASGFIRHVPSVTASPYDLNHFLRLRATNYGATITVALWVF